MKRNPTAHAYVALARAECAGITFRLDRDAIVYSLPDGAPGWLIAQLHPHRETIRELLHPRVAAAAPIDADDATLARVARATRQPLHVKVTRADLAALQRRIADEGAADETCL